MTDDVHYSVLLFGANVVVLASLVQLVAHLGRVRRPMRTTRNACSKRKELEDGVWKKKADVVGRWILDVFLVYREI